MIAIWGFLDEVVDGFFKDRFANLDVWTWSTLDI